MGVHNTPHTDRRWDRDESDPDSGADTAVATDGGSAERRGSDRDAIAETVEELFENRSETRPTVTSDDIQNALADDSTPVEARIELREALREVDLDDRDVVEEDLRAVMTAQKILEEDVRDLHGRVRELEHTLDQQ